MKFSASDFGARLEGTRVASLTRGIYHHPRKRKTDDSMAQDSKHEKTGELRLDYIRRGCRYAIDIMTTVENRTHVINALVAGMHVWICYHDH